MLRRSCPPRGTAVLLGVAGGDPEPHRLRGRHLTGRTAWSRSVSHAGIAIGPVIGGVLLERAGRRAGCSRSTRSRSWCRWLTRVRPGDFQRERHGRRARRARGVMAGSPLPLARPAAPAHVRRLVRVPARVRASAWWPTPPSRSRSARRSVGLRAPDRVLGVGLGRSVRPRGRWMTQRTRAGAGWWWAPSASRSPRSGVGVRARVRARAHLRCSRWACATASRSWPRTGSCSGGRPTRSGAG